MESLTILVGSFHAIFVLGCRTDEGTLVPKTKAAVCAEPGRAPRVPPLEKGLSPPKYARALLKAETRAIGRSRACSELQRNINYIRVHGFVLGGAPVPNKTRHSGWSCAASHYSRAKPVLALASVFANAGLVGAEAAERIVIRKDPSTVGARAAVRRQPQPSMPRHGSLPPAVLSA
jgi:hypothetical protein